MNFRPLKELVVVLMAIILIIVVFMVVYLIILGTLSFVNLEWYTPNGVAKYIIVCIALILTLFILKIAKS